MLQQHGRNVCWQLSQRNPLPPQSSLELGCEGTLGAAQEDLADAEPAASRRWAPQDRLASQLQTHLHVIKG